MPDDVADALKLLDEIAYSGRLKQTERTPAWQAIKVLHRFGVPDTICEGLVDGVRKLGSGDHGTQLAHQLKRARYHLRINGFTVRPGWYEG